MARHTDAELQSVLDAVNEFGGIRPASVALGTPYSSFREKVIFARLRAGEPKIAVTGNSDLTAVLAALAQSQQHIAKLLATSSPILVPPVAVAPAKKGRKVVEEVEADEEDIAKPVAGGTIQSRLSQIRTTAGRRFVLTSAQNNTYVHADFLAALLVYCEHNNAQLLVAPCTYNKNAWEQMAGLVTADTEGLWYDPAIEPYVSKEALHLAPTFLWCADFDRLPTATEPLSGLLDYTGASSGAFPHIQMRMQSVATGNYDTTKFLYTTGCVTQRNFIQRAAGKKAESNLKWAALVVEVADDGRWFARQLEADDAGVFHDLKKRYSASGVTTARVAAITWFDIHAEKADEVILAAAFDGPNSVMDILEPEHQFVEDLTDFERRNHHNIKNAYFRATMFQRGTDTVEGGMEVSAAVLKRMERTWCNTVVVESNHDQAFQRWLEEADGHRDAPNAEYWHRFNAKKFAAIREGRDDYLPFEDAIREKVSLINTVFLHEDESYKVRGVECGAYHGHRGKNGSRGGHKAYRGMGIKVTRGDEHTAGIYFDTFTSGASTMRMGYNKGMSSWSSSFTICYDGGGRSIVTMAEDGTWCVPDAPVAKPRIRVKATSAVQAST